MIENNIEVLSKMKELTFNEAHKLWMKKLSSNCEYRKAQTCHHSFNTPNFCKIQACPILYKANLRVKIQYIFSNIIEEKDKK